METISRVNLGLPRVKVLGVKDSVDSGKGAIYIKNIRRIVGFGPKFLNNLFYVGNENYPYCQNLKNQWERIVDSIVPSTHCFLRYTKIFSFSYSLNRETSYLIELDNLGLCPVLFKKYNNGIHSGIVMFSKDLAYVVSPLVIAFRDSDDSCLFDIEGGKFPRYEIPGFVFLGQPLLNNSTENDCKLGRDLWRIYLDLC